jgi:hypothetical protein
MLLATNGRDALNMARTAGYHLSAVERTDFILIRSPEGLSPDWRSFIAAHKPSILRELRAEQGVPTFMVTARGGPIVFADSIPGCKLMFRCPECDELNVHTGVFRKKGEGNGYRRSHCPCWPAGYFIIEV